MRHHLKKICIPAALAAAFLTVFALSNICGQTQNTIIHDADEAFNTYTDELFRQEVSANPLTLQYTLQSPEDYDITEYSTELGVYSAENIFISAALAENIAAVLNGFDENSLSTENRLTRDVLLDAMENTITAAEFPYYEEPLRPSTGVQSELPVLLAEYGFSNVQDIRDYLEILESLPDYLESICLYEQEKQKQGLFMSAAAADTVIAQCEDFAAAGENSYLIYTFEERTDHLTGLTENERTAYQKQNQTVVTQQVLPAFQEIADTLSVLRAHAYTDNTSVSSAAIGNSVLKESDDGSANQQTGLYGLPLGTNYYAFLVKSYTGSSDSVESLKTRIAAQRALDLSKIAALLEKYPDLASQSLLADAPCDTVEEMLDLLRTRMSEDFPPVQECNYTVKYADAAMADYLAPAFYLTSPLDDSSENFIYINDINGYEGIRLFTTLAHEGFPGHLYQNVYFNSTNPAPIRTLFGPVGYAEGWATYTEMISYQYAGLSEEMAEFLSLEQSAVLSLYATADLYIHSEGWTFSDTLDFFSDYGFSDEETIRDIFDLIAAEPAHYLKYYIGYLEFLELKEYAAEAFDSDYSDPAYHRAMLEMGPAPFSILKKYLNDYYYTDNGIVKYD